MKLGITERDKKLLIMLSIFVIVVGIGYWGIFPNLKKVKTINKEMEKQQQIKDENELKIMMLSDIKIANEKYEESIVEAREPFFSMMTSDMVDKYLTNMALDYKLNAYNLNIEMPKSEVDFSPYRLSAKAIEKAKEGNEFNGIVDGEVEEEIVAKTGVYCVTVSFKLGGSEKQLVKFIDDLANSDKKIRIRKYSWLDERNVSYDENGSYDIEVQKVLNITLDLFMCED